MSPTHQVTNQVPPLVDYDAARIDGPLQAALVRAAPDLAGGSVLGRRVGEPEVQQWAAEANAYPPVLRTHDRYGNRRDEVDFHPSWHRLMELSVSSGLHGAPWAATDAGAQLRRAVGFYLLSQAEAGHGCPISMTYAAVPALRHTPELAGRYENGLTATCYDPGLADPATKRGLLAGMGMTEKQGGSDVRANSTRAVPAGDGLWSLTGHKWFCSAPMCDLFLVLAQVGDAGLSCFCVPRVLPGGARNVFRLQRLKDKLGNRSNASAEVEFENTVGWLVGEPGRGIRAILDMVAMTRLDCVIGSAAGQRAALVQAIHHARHRSAFGSLLIEAPLMRNVLADLALEGEAATALLVRLASAVDDGEQPFLRLALPAAKYWVCKRSPAVVGEALECLGGNGYIEESPMPRLFRESPLNSIWEGSGNVICLDVLRALDRDHAAVAAVCAELEAASSADHRFQQALTAFKDMIRRPEPAMARRIAGYLALLLQASLLLRHGPPAVADAFCATRLGGDWGHTFGTLPGGIDPSLLLDRAFAG